MNICKYCTKEHCSYEKHSAECQLSRVICYFCVDHSEDDRLYEYREMDGNITFEPIRITYCPLCGKKLEV